MSATRVFGNLFLWKRRDLSFDHGADARNGSTAKPPREHPLTDRRKRTATQGLRHDAFGVRSALGGNDDSNTTAFQYAGAWGSQREEAPGLGPDLLHHRYSHAEAERVITRDPIWWARLRIRRSRRHWGPDGACLR